MTDPNAPAPPFGEPGSSRHGFLRAILGFMFGVLLAAPLAIVAGLGMFSYPDRGWKAAAYFVLLTAALIAVVFTIRRMGKRTPFLKAMLVGVTLVLLLTETCAGCLVAGR